MFTVPDKDGKADPLGEFIPFPPFLLLKSSALSVHYCPPCPSVRYSFESFAVCLWININPCEVVDVMPGVFTSFQRVSFEDEKKKKRLSSFKEPVALLC